MPKYKPLTHGALSVQPNHNARITFIIRESNLYYSICKTATSWKLHITLYTLENMYKYSTVNLKIIYKH